NRDAWISDHVDDVNDAAGMYAGAKWGRVAAVKTMIQGKLAKKLLGSFVDRIGKMVAAEPAPTVS
ncbi:MAG TPA: hypothetical protein PKY30_19795, partial [Myxococcota bacterium]|nr:hypothetical protein [Myxococcota bacterium]